MKMNRRLGVVLAIALMSSAAAFASAQTASNAEFKALIDGYYKAWTIPEGKGAQVPDNAARYYAKDADLVFFDIAPMKYDGWAQQEYRRAQ
jgi:uncharacterized protein (DUF952 family)